MINIRKFPLYLLAFVPFGVALGQPSWPRPPRASEPSAAQMEVMRHGAVLVETLNEAKGGGSARVRGMFRTTPRNLWDILGDCEANFRFVQGLRECEIEEQGPEHAVTRQVAKKHWLAPTLAYRFETRRQPYEWIMIRLLDGDLEALQGNWRFDPVPGSELLLVTHEIMVHPKVPAPRWLVRRTLQRDLEEMIACLRYVADASLDSAGAQADQAQCPKPATD